MNRTGFGGEVVLLIGGAGFLGQHIVRELQLHSDFGEIRVFDIKPYVNQLGHEERRGDRPVTSLVGDVRNASELRAAMVGVRAVVHCAGVVDVRLFPDLKHLRDVNVTGTRNVLDACAQLNIQYLVFTSTVDAVVGYDDIINGNESLPDPDRLIFEGYGGTKREAERLVLAANKTGSSDGPGLHTLSLRPTCLYGELDPFFVSAILKAAKSRGGTLTRVGDGSAIFQATYAGNAAWAHVCALYALRADPGAVGGAAYFVTDDTPAKNNFDLVAPFLASRDMRVSKRAVPYWLVYAIFWLLEVVLGIARVCNGTVNFDMSLGSIVYINRRLWFSRERAKGRLGYEPKYSYEEALGKSAGYYRQLPL